MTFTMNYQCSKSLSPVLIKYKPPTKSVINRRIDADKRTVIPLLLSSVGQNANQNCHVSCKCKQCTNRTCFTTYPSKTETDIDLCSTNEHLYPMLWYGKLQE